MKYIVEMFKNDAWQVKAMFADFDDAQDFAAYAYGIKARIRDITTNEIVVEMDDA